MEDFEMAFAIAQQMYQEKDPIIQAEKSGSIWTDYGSSGEGVARAELPFLGTPYLIKGPEGDVCYKEDTGKEPALWEKIIVLHYFTTSDGTPLSQKWISVKEIPDSRLYLTNFEKRAVTPLLGRFGNNPEKIWEPARKLGGRKADVGDVAFTLPVFPRVPITLQFWKADEEFPPRINILFDKTIIHYLPTEDIILASQMLTFRLIGLAGKP